MRIVHLAVLAAVMATVPALAQSPYAGTATGSLVVDGKAIPLKYSYVVEVDNVEEAGLQMASARKSTVIVLCDQALPLASVCNREAPFAERRSPAQYMAPVTKGVAYKVYGILLKLEPGKANPRAADLLFPNNDSLSMTIAGTEYPDRVTGLKRDGKFLSGAAQLTTVQATHLEKGPKKYKYNVIFRAPVLQEEPVKENLEGSAALASAPVKVIKQYMEAGKKGDAASLKSLTAATHLSYTSNKEFLESLKSVEMEKLPEQVKRVVVRGDTATVVVVNEQPSYSQVMMHLVREKGDWKLCWP